MRRFAKQCGAACPSTMSVIGKADFALMRSDSRFLPNCMVRPSVASGFAELAVSGLASMYPAFDWSICSGPSWISARVRSRYRTGLDWTIWVTSVRMRREDRTSISSHPLADLGWKLLIGYVIACSSYRAVPLFEPRAVPSPRPAERRSRRAQGRSAAAICFPREVRSCFRRAEFAFYPRTRAAATTRPAEW
jgi:hypothetical protein